MFHDPASPETSPADAVLDQLIVRAHYLALDLRVAVRECTVVDPAITTIAADFLRYWATEAGKGRSD